MFSSAHDLEKRSLLLGLFFKGNGRKTRFIVERNISLLEPVICGDSGDGQCSSMFVFPCGCLAMFMTLENVHYFWRCSSKEIEGKTKTSGLRKNISVTAHNMCVVKQCLIICTATFRTKTQDISRNGQEEIC